MKTVSGDSEFLDEDADRSQNQFSDEPKVRTLTTPDGLVCPACPVLDLGSKIDHPSSVEIQNFDSIQFAMSTLLTENGTHPCRTLCETIAQSLADPDPDYAGQPVRVVMPT